MPNADRGKLGAKVCPTRFKGAAVSGSWAGNCCNNFSALHRPSTRMRFPRPMGHSITLVNEEQRMS